MRFIVLLIGLPAIALTALTGVGLIFFNMAVDGIQPFLKDILQIEEIPAWAYESLTHFGHAETGVLLIVAAGYGFLGVVLSFLRCGWQGATLLIVPVIFTTVMNPFTAAFASAQVFAGLLSFLVFPVPIQASAQDKDDDEDDED